VNTGNVARLGGQQRRNATEASDERVRDVERGAAAGAGAQEKRDKLGVGERCGAAREQTLTRLLCAGFVSSER
jgi:hypothetical protein